MGGGLFLPDNGDERIPLRVRPSPGPVVLGIRPEFVRPDPAGPLRGQVILSEFLGDSRCLHARTSCGTIVARTGPGLRPERDSEVRLALDEAHIQWFDPATEERRQ